jgi:23S rRNA pseudouridine1911/1915/1917 synthase
LILILQLSIFPNPKIPFDIIAQTEHYLVVYKPANLSTQPGIGHEQDTLMNAAFDRFGTTLQNLGKKRDFGLLHRLDQGTSGIILIALTIDGYDQLRALFENHLLQKRYVVLIHGAIQPIKGIIDYPIAEKIIQGRKKAVVGEGQSALTKYKVIDQNQQASLLNCEIVTGKLHQIRAHFAALRHPVIGDYEYGHLGSQSPLNQQFKKIARHHLALHAKQISFDDPWLKQKVTYQADLSTAFQSMLAVLGLSDLKD